MTAEKVMFQYDKKDNARIDSAMKDHKQKVENAEIHRKKAIIAARRCLKLKAFDAYRQNYKQCEKSLVEALLVLPFTDAVTYAVQVKDLIDRIRNLRVLLKDVEKKAK